MGAYNGFSDSQRNAAQRWLNLEIASGRLTRPTVCVACGQDKPPIDMHAEDYSLPFAQGKTDEFHLCFNCHMAVHCRFKNPSAWDQYRERVAAGWRYPAIGRNFPLFIKRFSNGTALIEIAEKCVAPDQRPLDVIDGWLLANTGKGWR